MASAACATTASTKHGRGLPLESVSVSFSRWPRWLGYPAAVLLVIAAIVVLKLFPNMADSSVALLLLLAVFACAWIWESGPGVVAAIVATMGFNFFFIPPLYTFTVEDPRNVAALFVFLISGLLIGRLSALNRERLRQVEAERRDLASLTRLSEAFLSDTNRESLLGRSGRPAPRGTPGLPRRDPDRRREEGAFDRRRHRRFRVPLGARGSRVPAGQLGGISVGGGRHRHLSADPGRRAESRRPRGEGPALERADGGGLRRSCLVWRSSVNGS